MDMELKSYDPVEDKQRYKLVRTDDYTDVIGDIVAANEATGECVVVVAKPDGATEQKQLNLGPRGLRIVPRERR